MLMFELPSRKRKYVSKSSIQTVNQMPTKISARCVSCVLAFSNFTLVSTRTVSNCASKLDEN